MITRDAKQLSIIRLRLSQRLLIAASDADPALVEDEYWQAALLKLTTTLTRQDNPNPERKVAELSALGQEILESHAKPIKHAKVGSKTQTRRVGETQGNFQEPIPGSGPFRSGG